MRILQVHEPTAGGVPAYVRALASGLVRRGHAVDVAAPWDDGSARALREVGATPVRVELVPTMVAARANARGLLGLVRLVRGGGYDVVHVHDAKAGALGRAAGRLTRAPVAYTPHALRYRSQHLRDRRFPRARRALTLRIERALAPLADAILCISEHQRRVLLEDGVADAARVRVVHPGIAGPNGQPVPDPELARFRGRGPLVGFLGRLSPEKGVEVLIDALVVLRERGKLPPVAIVGSGPLQEAILGRIVADDLSERVVVKPYREPVWPLLAAFDVFVLPSLWDAMPIALLEAMAAGLPAAASAVEGVPEAVEAGRTGLLVPPGEAAALASAIARLADDESTRAAMGAAARRRYLERFTLDAMVEGVEGAYRQLTAQAARRAAPLSPLR